MAMIVKDFLKRTVDNHRKERIYKTNPPQPVVYSKPFGTTNFLRNITSTIENSVFLILKKSKKYLTNLK